MAKIIRKAQEGLNTSELQTARLFTDGKRQIDLDRLIQNIGKNLNSYISSQNWNKRKQQAFQSAVNDYIQAIDQGNISQRDVTRKYIDTTGRIKNSENKKYDPYGEAAYFIDTIIDALPDYKKPEEKPKEKKKFDVNGLNTYFRNYYFGGNDPDAVIWQQRDIKDEGTGKYSTINRAAAFADMLEKYVNDLNTSTDEIDFSGSAYKDKQEYLNKLQNAITRLRAGDVTNSDLSALAAIGISGDNLQMLFSKDPIVRAGQEDQQDKPKSKEEQLQQEIDDFNSQNQYDLSKEQLEINRKLKDAALELSKKYYTPELQRYSGWSSVIPSPNYNKDSLEDLYQVDKNPTKLAAGIQKFYDYLKIYQPSMADKLMEMPYLKLKGNYTFNNSLANWFDYTKPQSVAIKDNNYRGFYYYPEAIANNGTVIIYNPVTREMRRVAAWNIADIRDYLMGQERTRIMADYPLAMLSQNQIAPEAKKNGGVLKAQQGLSMAEFIAQRQKAVRERKAQAKAAEQKKLQEEITATGRTEEEIKAGRRAISESGLTATDWTRIGAAAADAASMVAAFVPGYGTAASAALGLGSSGATLFTDIKEDGFQWGDLGNFAANLGMDVVGLVPGFGAAGKSAKIVKNLVKYVPRLVTLATAISVAPEAIASIKKIGTDEKLTVDDWRNIASGLSTIAGLSRMGAASMKASAMKQHFSTGDKTVRSKSGKMMRTTPEELEKLKKAKSLEESNEIIQNLKSGDGKGEELASTFRKWYNPTLFWNNNPRTGEYFDFTKPRTSRLKGSDVTIFQKSANGYLPFPSTHLKVGNFYLRGHKSGGVLKAKDGNTIYATGDLGYNTYLTQIAQNPEFLNWIISNYTGEQALSNYSNAIKQNVDQRYKYGINNYNNETTFPEISQDVIDFNTGYQNQGKTPNYVLFGNSSEDYDNKTKGIVYGLVDWNRPKLPANEGDRYHGDSSKDYIGGALGAQTFSRILAPTNPSLTSGNFGQWGWNMQRLGATGAYYYKDPQGKGQWIPTNDSNVGGYIPFDNTQAQESLTPIPTTIDWSKLKTSPSESSGSHNPSKGVNLSNLRLSLPGVLEGVRLALALDNNRKVRDLTLQGLKPLIRDTYNLNRTVTGDYAGQRSYYNAANRLQSLAAKPRTTDSSLQTAAQLDATIKGNEQKVAGDLLNNKAIRESAEKAWQVQADNTARRSQVANQNRASILQIRKAKKDIEAMTKSANWQSIDAYLKYLTAKARQRDDRQRAFDLKVATQAATTNATREIDKEIALLKQKLATMDQEEMFTSDEYRQLLQKQREKQSILNNAYNQAYADVYNLNYSTPTLPWSPTIYKSGGQVEKTLIKARTEEAKLFQNNIQQSVKNHIKMINNLSSVTKQLILKAMTL